MKLYEIPKTYADLEIGDIVYVVVNGEIMQAKLKEYKTIYNLGITETLEINDKSYYIFITPNGLEIKVTYNSYRGKDAVSTPQMYATLELLRQNGFHTELQWDYGYPGNSYNCKTNADARKRFINAVSKKYGISMFGSPYCFRLYFNSKKTKQIKELNFPTFTDDGCGDLYVSHCGNDYGYIEDLLESGYYPTKEDCERNYTPKVLTFNDDKPQKKIFVVTTDFADNDLFGNIFLEVFENEKNAKLAFSKEKLKLINSLEDDNIDYVVNKDTETQFVCSDAELMYKVTLVEKKLS